MARWRDIDCSTELYSEWDESQRRRMRVCILWKWMSKNRGNTALKKRKQKINQRKYTSRLLDAKSLKRGSMACRQLKMPIKMLNEILWTRQLATEIKRHTERHTSIGKTETEKRSWQLSLHEVTVNILPFSMGSVRLICARFVMRTCPFGILSSVIVQVKCFPFERCAHTEWVSECVCFFCSLRLETENTKDRVSMNVVRLPAPNLDLQCAAQRHFNEIHWPFGWAQNYRKRVY